MWLAIVGLGFEQVRLGPCGNIIFYVSHTQTHDASSHHTRQFSTVQANAAMPQDEAFHTTAFVTPLCHCRQSFAISTHKMLCTVCALLKNPPNCVVALEVLTVGVKRRCLIEVLHRRVRLIHCYLQYIHASRNPRSEFRLRRLAKSDGPRWVLVAPCAFSDPVVTFRGRGKGKLTFRDRCKGSERGYLDVQISWQAQHFGHGGDLGGALSL